MIAAMFIVAVAALFLKMRGQFERARDLYGLCKQFAVFDKSAYFATLYRPYFRDCEFTRAGNEEGDLSPELLWQAVGDLPASSDLFV